MSIPTVWTYIRIWTPTWKCAAMPRRSFTSWDSDRSNIPFRESSRSPNSESPLSRQARAVFARETIRESGGRCEFHAGFGRNAGAGRRERLRQNDAGPRDCASHRVGYGQRIVRWRRHHPTGWGAVASAAAETADDFSRPVWLLEPAH